MPIDASIYGNLQPARINTPFENLAQINQIRAQQQAIQSNQALEQERRQKIAKEQQAEAEQQKFYAILAKPGQTPDGAAEDIRQQVPSLYQPYLKQRSELDAKAAEVRAARDKSKQFQQEAAAKGNEYAQPFLQLVEKSGYNPDTFKFALTTIQSHFDEFPAEQMWQQAGGDPAKIKALIDGFKSPQQQNADVTAQTAAAQRPGQVATSQMQQQVAAGMQGGLTPDQQRQQAQATAAAAEAARHNRSQEGFERQRIGIEAQKAAQAQNDVTNLTPEGLDAAAMMFAKTGQLPALGMGDKTTRKAIINRAAAMTPGLDIASAKADFGANSDSLKVLQKQRDAISAFEQTASKNIDLFLDTAGKVVDTGSPLANTYVRAVSGKLLGSPDQAAYDAARQVAINEIAKITQGGGLSGVLSDSARKEIGDFNPKSATLKQTVQVMRTLKQDMANRASSMDDQIVAIKNRIGKATGAAPAASGPKVGEVRTANGETRRWTGSAWELVR